MRRVFFLLLSALLWTSAFAQTYKAPDFSSDSEWIDQGLSGVKVPHSIKGYRGRVVLVDFWEYTCINCIRDFSVLKRWYSKYQPFGFEVIGVHFGEFPMGYKTQNVRDAAKRFRLPWPVVSDIHGAIWKAYKSEAWPNRYLIDPNGQVVMHIEGEGNNRAMEQKVQELLLPGHPEVSKVALDPDEQTFAPQCGICTDETYVGNWFGRGAVENAQGYHDEMITDFKPDKEPKDGGVILSGRWRTAQNGMTYIGQKGTVKLHYHARSVYAVLSVEKTEKPVRIDIQQDGKPLAKGEAGKDVHFDAEGSYLEVSEPRMYYLLQNTEFGAHVLLLEPQGKNEMTLHSFTYGNNCQQDFEPL